MSALDVLDSFEKITKVMSTLNRYLERQELNMMKSFFAKIVMLVFFLVCNSANAIGVSSMIEFSDEFGDATITVINTDDTRQYVDVIVSEVLVENGQLTYVPYNRNNVADWELEVIPARMILEPKLQKDFKASYRPNSQEVQSKEKVFKLDIVPTPYVKPGEESANLVKMAFGVSSFIVIPRKISEPIKYSVSYRGDKLYISNLWGSYFTANIDTCNVDTPLSLRDSCSKKAHLLAGRDLVVTLPPEMQHKGAVNITFSSFDGKVKESSTFINEAS